MTEQLNAIINARLPRKDGLYKLTIAGGRFTNILPMLGPPPLGTTNWMPPATWLRRPLSNPST